MNSQYAGNRSIVNRGMLSNRRLKRQQCEPNCKEDRDFMLDKKLERMNVDQIY